MARAKREEDPAPGAPLWVLSFGDMITNLMAFFVLLQSFASVQDAGLISVGRGSFKQAIAGFGLPGWLFGQSDRPSLGFVKPEHPTDEGEPELPPPRVIDADNEKIRRMFDDLRQELDSTASNASGELLRVEVTPISFAGADPALNEAAGSYLRQFVEDLRQAVRARSLRFYVIGLAAEQTDRRAQWRVSAARAAAVERRLGELFGQAGEGSGLWSVYGWGAGAGDEWCRRHGSLPGRTSIIIAVMKDRADHG